MGWPIRSHALRPAIRRIPIRDGRRHVWSAEILFAGGVDRCFPVVGRKHEQAVGLEDARHFGEEGGEIDAVFDDTKAGDGVEKFVGEAGGGDVAGFVMNWATLDGAFEGEVNAGEVAVAVGVKGGKKTE